MMSFSASLIWFLIGVGFLICEMFLPGFILIFFTAGCWIAALAAWLLGVQLTSQIIIFIVSSLILLITLRKYSLKTFKGTTREDVDDQYTESKIGKTGVVSKKIAPHMPGEIKVMGSFWRATAEVEIDEGKSVLVESQDSEDGLTLKVKPL
jgi:membrane protein implicated in regulation of membrane protease activity